MPAAERTEIAFAKGRSFTRHQVHVSWSLSLHFWEIDRVLRTFIATQFMPKLSVGFQVSPFFLERHRHSHTDVTAKRLAGKVVLPADQATIHIANR